ncbi:DUF4249 domain-containing protein [bacterium]|nr:DUF4249 domain-containing protein [bacterium]
MKSSQLILFAIFLFHLILGGCSTQPSEVEDYESQLVLSAFPCNGEPLERVYLERVASIDVYYSFSQQGIAGADVNVYTCEEGVIVDSFAFQDHPHPDSSGVYIPVGGGITPQSGQELLLTTVTGTDSLWAKTTVPGKMDSVVWLNPHNAPDTVEVQPFWELEAELLTLGHEEIKIGWQPVEYAGGYSYFVLSLSPELIPLDPEWDVGEFGDTNPDNPNRGGYSVFREDQQVVTIPWFLFRWIGEYRIGILAVSPEYYDFLFSSFRMRQGLTEKQESNIHGGLGIFGAVSKVEARFYMTRE